MAHETYCKNVSIGSCTNKLSPSLVPQQQRFAWLAFFSLPADLTFVTTRIELRALEPVVIRNGEKRQPPMYQCQDLRTQRVIVMVHPSRHRG